MKKLLTSSLAILVAACGGELDTPTEGVTESELQSFSSNARLVWFYYTSDPAVGRNSFAAAYLNQSCSGIMIGPSLYMTASHCEPGNNPTIHFRVYERAGRFRLESFQCTRLFDTENDTDMEVFHCPPNTPGGPRPGDKYGYADVSGHIGDIGDEVYSIWRNPINDIGDTNVLLYSEGEITQVNPVTYWENPAWNVNNPLCVNGTANRANQSQVGQRTNVWGAPGASGSVQFDANTHQILFGPTTGGSNNTSVGGALRNSVNWALWLWQGHIPDANVDANGDGIIDAKACFNGRFPATNDAYLASEFNISGSSYRARRLDTDFDQVVDLVEAIERSEGESAREYYAPTFTSARSNANWILYDNPSVFIDWPHLGAVVFDRDDGTMTLRSGQGNVPVAAFPFPMRSSTTYVVRFDVTFPSSSASTQLRVCLDGTGTCRYVTPSNSGRMIWRMTATSGASAVEFELVGPGSAEISDVVISERDIVLDFDEHDKRRDWVYEYSRKPAPILPLGYDSGGAVDFAGLVSREHYRSPVVHRGSQLAPSKYGYVCFRAKPYNSLSFTGAKMHIESENGRFHTKSVTFDSGTWKHQCSLFYVPANHDRLEIEFDTVSGKEWLVDDIRVYTP